MDMLFPDTLVTSIIDLRLLQHLETSRHLILVRSRLVMQFERIAREIATEDIKHFVHEVVVEAIDLGVFEDQLTIDNQRKDLAAGQQVIDVATLLLGGRAIL